MNQKVDKLTSVMNPEENGGESLTITTEFYDNGDKTNNIYLNQTITLNSYGNSASFNLIGSPLTPEVLRKLAEDIENTYFLHVRG